MRITFTKRPLCRHLLLLQPLCNKRVFALPLVAPQTERFEWRAGVVGVVGCDRADEETYDPASAEASSIIKPHRSFEQTQPEEGRVSGGRQTKRKQKRKRHGRGRERRRAPRAQRARPGVVRRARRHLLPVPFSLGAGPGRPALPLRARVAVPGRVAGRLPAPLGRRVCDGRRRRQG
jgi:hypothetical protein